MKTDGIVLGLARAGDEVLDRRTPGEKRPSDRSASGSFSSVHPQVEPITPAAGTTGRVEMAKLLPPMNDRSGAETCQEPEAGQAKCHPPDDVYIGECYQKILALEGTGTRSEIIAGIHEILAGMAKTAETDNRSYTSMVDSLLMLHWTRKEGESTSYDTHMDEHVKAISVLIQAMMKNRPIGGKYRILDASCGTGKVLEATLDAMGPKARRKLSIVANDISAAAIEQTKKTLTQEKYAGQLKKVEYTRYDLTQELPPGRFDLIILSQTLALICDEKALRDKRLGREVPYETRHNTAKGKLLEALFKKVKPGKGEFWLIDEDPMKLSELPEDFYGIVEETLFREIFTECPMDTLVNVVMKQIPDARFRSHAVDYIDRKHAMHLINSTSIRSHDLSINDLSCGLESPPSGVMDVKGPAQVSRELADEERYRKKILTRMRSMHPDIAARLQMFEGTNGTVFKSIQEGQKTLVIDKAYYDEHIANKHGYWRTNGHYDLVVISGLIHHLGKEEYRCLIKKLHQSKKAPPGSALLFIDTFPAPPGSTSPVGNTKARTLVFSADDHVFCASVRYGNRYGYLYAVKDLGR